MARRPRPPAASRAAGRQRDDLRHGRGRRERSGVAGVHAAEQRLDQPVDDLVAEPRADAARRPRRRRRPAGSAVSCAARSRPSAEQHARGARPVEVERDAHAACAGSGRSAPRVHSRRRGRRRVHDLGRRGRRLGERRPPRAPGEHRLGAHVDRRRRPTVGQRGACRRRRASPRARRTRRPARGQVAGRGQAGDPAAHDGDAPRQASGVVRARARTRRRGSARRGRSSGSTPCPRLKTWPLAARPASMISRGPRASSPRSARTAASGRGCPARRGRRPGGIASSSGVRQSTPTTSAPASPISGEQARRCRRRSGSAARRGRRPPRARRAECGST